MTAIEPRAALGAALLGAAGGMRTMMPPAALALSGKLGSNQPVRIALMVAAAGELVGDKLPTAPARTMPTAFGGRIVSAGFCGFQVAATPGALVGAATGALSTALSYTARRAIVQRSWLKDPIVAVAEDSLAICLSAAGLRIATTA